MELKVCEIPFHIYNFYTCDVLSIDKPGDIWGWCSLGFTAKHGSRASSSIDVPWESPWIKLGISCNIKHTGTG